MPNTIETINHPTIHTAFESVAGMWPDRPAVVCDGVVLTFRELNERSNQLAARLAALGAGPNKLTGLMARRSVDMVVGVLGIWKAGGAFVPVDLTYPESRMLTLLQDASFEIVIAPDEISSDFFAGRVKTVLMDDATLRSEKCDNPSSTSAATDLAYVIYTSGTTGVPNGVMIEHRSVINLANGLQQTIYRGYGDVSPNVAVNAPLAFDASIKQMAQLMFGRCLHIVPQRLRRNPADLTTWIKQSDVNVLDCTPSQVRVLMDAGLDTKLAAPAIVLVGGEAIDSDCWNRLASVKNVDFYNVYGPTECTVDTTVARVSAEATPNIGRPLPNVSVHVLDSDLRPVQAGDIGELFVGGAGLAQGYWNRPDLTADRFRNDIDALDGARVYRTGDLARSLPGGNLEFHGRIDDQVKVRGFRIELGEIESVLRQHSSVFDAAALVRVDGADDQRLVAYVVAKPNEAVNIVALRTHLTERLPDYMVPSSIVPVDAIPLTANGKTDRNALASKESAVVENKPVVEAPDNPLEAVLCRMCANVLGVESVGVDDNFFELGGHSLLATQFIAQLQDIFPSEEPLLGVFFQEPTVSALADAIVQNAGGIDVDKIAEIIETVMTMSDDEVDMMLAKDTQ